MRNGSSLGNRLSNLRMSIRFSQLQLPGKLLLFTVNIENKIRGTQTIISVDKSSGFYIARDDKYKIYFCRIERILLYAHGVSNRLEELARIYHLDELKLSADSVFLDCGANVGEVSVYVSENFGSKVISVEPEDLEFRCLTLNMQETNSVLFNGALWSESTILDFYSKPNTADSSAIYFGDEVAVKRVQAITLDELISPHINVNRTILKIEAEGAEPEVLLGGVKTIESTFGIVIDGGPERGLRREKTEPQNDVFLKNRGFQKSESATRAQLYLRK